MVDSSLVGWLVGCVGVTCPSVCVCVFSFCQNFRFDKKGFFGRLNKKVDLDYTYLTKMVFAF